MLLDNTLVVIRSRSALELIDLTIVLVRQELWPIVIRAIIGWLPWLFINVIVQQPFVVRHWDDIGVNGYDDGANYVESAWHLLLLMYLQAPVASLPVCYYIGHRMFRSTPSLSETISQCFRAPIKKFTTLLLTRGVVVAVITVAVISWSDAQSVALEFFVLGMCVLLPTTFIRMVRPMAPEILSLESFSIANLKATPDDNKAALIKFGQRMKMLHKPLASEHLGRFAVISLVASLMFVFLTLSELWLCQLFMREDTWNWYFNIIALPLNFVIVSTFAAVYRFLCYIDARILLEGWEVRLRFLAEANRILDLPT